MSADDRTGLLRAEAARVLDAAMRATRTTNGCLGDACDVDEKRVRRWRSDDAADLEAAPPMTVLLGCSWEAFEHMVTSLRRVRVGLHGASTTKTPEQLLAAAIGAGGRVASVGGDVLADLVIEGVEEPAIIDALTESNVANTAVIDALKKRRER